MNQIVHDTFLQAKALLVQPIAPAVVALLLSVVALCLVLMKANARKLAHASAIDFRKREQQWLAEKRTKVATLERSLKQRRKLTAAPEELTTESPLPPMAAPPLSPLEAKRARIIQILADLLGSLEQWAQLAGFSLDAEVGVRSQLNRLQREVQPPAGDESLDHAINDELPPILTETVKVLLLKSDRDCDPERTNVNLQNHLLHLTRPAHPLRLGLIDPAKGDRLNPQEHDSFGFVQGRGSHERGRVAATRVRGLKWNEQVVMRAEVLEYD